MKKLILVVVACLLLSYRLRVFFRYLLVLLSIPVYPVGMVMFYYGPSNGGGRWDHSHAVCLDNWIGGLKRFRQLALAIVGLIILYSTLAIDFHNYRIGLVSLKGSLIFLWFQLPALTLMGIIIAVSFERFSNAYSADKASWEQNPIFGD